MTTKRIKHVTDIRKVLPPKLWTVEEAGGVRVLQKLYLSKHKIDGLGNLLSVAGILNINRSTITTLGSLQRAGMIKASQVPLKDLGALTHVDDGLYLDNTKVETLGCLRNATTIQVEDSPLSSLGALEEAYSLTLVRAPITTLGTTLRALQYLTLNETGVTSLVGTGIKVLKRLSIIGNHVLVDIGEAVVTTVSVFAGNSHWGQEEYYKEMSGEGYKKFYAKYSKMSAATASLEILRHKEGTIKHSVAAAVLQGYYKNKR